MEGIEHIRHGDEAQWLSTLGVCGLEELRSPIDVPSPDPDQDSIEDVAEYDGEVRLDISREGTPTPDVYLSDASDRQRG